MKKLRVEEVIVVEGKYDAVKLADLVDGLILTTNGFSVFKNAETKRLLVELGKKRGIIVLTDSDDAGKRRSAQGAPSPIPTCTSWVFPAQREARACGAPGCKALACRRAFPKKRCARCSTACTLMRNSYRPCRETVLR